MTENASWRPHVQAAITDIQEAMKGISTDPPNAWKEGLLIEALQKLETTLDTEENDHD